MVAPFETWFLTLIGIYLFVYGVVALRFEYREGSKMSSEDKVCKCLKGEDPWGKPYVCRCDSNTDKRLEGNDPWGKSYVEVKK